MQQLFFFLLFIFEKRRLSAEVQWLNGRKPGLSLKETAHYFLDLLSPAEYSYLQGVCQMLSGKPIMIGTTCSGLETGGMVIEKTFAALNERFGTNVSSRVAFAAELHKD